MAPSGNPVPPELRERILDLRAEGLSDEAIGELVGRTGGSVRHIIAKARRAGDPRAAYLTEDARRRRIIASRNPAPASAAIQSYNATRWSALTAEEREANRLRLKEWRANNRDRDRAHKQKWKANSADKAKAHKAVELAVLRGVLVRQPCERCGATDLVHAHHDDYSAPLSVTWLCPTHHKARHRELAEIASATSSGDCFPPGAPGSSPGGVPPLTCAGSEQSDPAAFWAEICAHYERGASASSLAARYGRSTTTIRRYLSRAGLIECTDDVKPAQKLDAKERRCLVCLAMFMSSWAGDRKCKRCRSKDNEGAGAWR